MTTAFVGAGVVALGTASALSDQKSTDAKAMSADPALTGARSGSGAGVGSPTDTDRSNAERASRGTARTNPNPAPQALQAAPDYWDLPVANYELTSTFGQRWGTLHAGVDLAAPTGTPVRAVKAGVIKTAAWYGGYGMAVIIDHGNGVVTLYGHNSALKVQQGQRVETGQLIALMGSTGYSYGSHCHFEVHIDGVQKDPMSWMRERGVDLLKRARTATDNNGNPIRT